MNVGDWVNLNGTPHQVCGIHVNLSGRWLTLRNDRTGECDILHAAQVRVHQLNALRKQCMLCNGRGTVIDQDWIEFPCPRCERQLDETGT